MDKGFPLYLRGRKIACLRLGVKRPRVRISPLRPKKQRNHGGLRPPWFSVVGAYFAFGAVLVPF